jgi:hypothetical protein
MMTDRQRNILALIAFATLLSGSNASAAHHSMRVSPGPSPTDKISLVRTPNNGIQPQAVMDARGCLHLIYFTGEPGGGDVYYLRREPGKEAFSTPRRVNSQPGSVIATGTVRGAQLAVGRGGRVHVSWMGSNLAEPKGPNGATPMLYTRLNDQQTAFEPQRNLIRAAVGLDGGGSVAADDKGNVYVAWHGQGDQKGETYRRVWVARSRDDGKTFDHETKAFNEETGACGCCGMRAFADREGRVHFLYRAATRMVDRDMYLLSSNDHGESFQGRRLHPWKLTTCPMSTATIAQSDKRLLVAWETAGQVFFTDAASPGASPISAPENATDRKHPSIAGNQRGETLLVWAEGTGWKKGGTLAWQLFDRDGKPIGERGHADGVPVWGLPTAVAHPSGEFTIIY